jgi:hypothetical protein
VQYAGRNWAYSYRKLFELCPEKELAQVAGGHCSAIRAPDEGLDKRQRNSEWSCRIYFTTKMILNATVLLNSLEFARTSGLRARQSIL